MAMEPTIDPVTGEPVLVIPAEPPTPVTDPPAATTAPAAQTFTAEDIQRVRQEEKDKLYKTIEDMKSKVDTLASREKAEAKAAADADAEAKRIAKQAAEDEMSAKELIESKEREWSEKFAGLERKTEEQEALLERERQYNGLVIYRQQLLESPEVANTIAPQLLDYVWGETPEEIDNAVAIAQQKSASILEEVQAAQQSARNNLRGTSVTQPPVGPLETSQPSHETYTPQQLRDMPMSEYIQKRTALMGASSALVRNSGVYGAGR